MALQKSGVALIAEGISTFLSDLTKASTGQQQLGQTAAAAAPQVTALGGAAAGVQKSLAGTGAAAQKSATEMAALAAAAQRAESISALNAKLATQKQELGILQQELAKTAAKYGESSTQAQRKQLAVDKLTSAIGKTESAIKTETTAQEHEVKAAAEAAKALQDEAQAADNAAKETQQAAKSNQEVGQAAAAAAHPVENLGKAAADSGQHFAAFREMSIGALREIGSMAVQAMGQAVQAIGQFAASTITVAGNFEAGFNAFQAAAGKGIDTTGLAQFRQMFIDLGRELPVSTTEVEQAATEMVTGGIDPAIVAAGGLRSTIQFAAAAQMSLGDAAETSAKILAGWTNTSDSAASKAAFLASSTDTLTKAAAASSTTVAELRLGIFNVQGAAQALHAPFEDVVATLAKLAPAFQSSAQAGTALNVFMTRLVPQTKPATEAMKEFGLITKDGQNAFFDAKGNFLGMGNAAEQLRIHLNGLSDEQKISALHTLFGNDAQKVANLLMQEGAAGLNGMKSAMAGANGVSEQAALMQSGYNTALENAKGSVEALQITIGSALLPVLTTLLNGVIAPGINTLTSLAAAITGDQAAFATLSPTLQAVATTFQYLGQIAGEAFASFQTDGLGAGISTFAAGLMQLSPALGTAVGLLAPFADFLQNNLVPALVGIGIAITGGIVVAFGLLIASALPVIATIAAIAAAGALIVAAWQSDFGGIQGIVSGALAGISALWAAYGPTITATASAIWTGAVSTAGAVLGALVGIVSGVLSGIQSFWATNGATIVATATATWNSVSATISGVLSGIMGIVAPILSSIAAFWATNGADIQATAATVWGQIGSIVTGTMQIIGAIIQTEMAVIQGTIIPAFQAIGSFIAAHGAEIQTVMQASWNAVSTIVTTVLSVIQGLIIATMQAINGNWSGAWETIKNTCATLVQGAANVVADILSTFPAIFSMAFDGVFGVLAGLVGRFNSAGANFIRGMADGIKSQIGALASEAANAAKAALDAAKNALGIHSPSQAAADEVGQPFVEGIELGITKAIPPMIDTASAMARGVLNATKTELGAESGTSTEGATVGLSFVKGIVAGVADSLTLIKGMARHLSKQLTEDMQKVAQEAADAFKAVLQAGLEADVGFSGTKLGNFKAINAITDDSGLEDSVKAQRDAQAKLDEAKAKGTADEQAEQAKVAGLEAERTKKIADLRARITADEANRQWDLQQVRQDDSLTEEERTKQLAAINKKYDDQHVSYLDQIGSINADYGQQILDAEAAYTKQNEALQQQLADLQKALDLAKARVLVEQQLDKTKQDIQARAREDLTNVEKEAQALRATDPKAADDYYKLRSQQILALAKLEQDRAEALATYQQSGSQDDRDRFNNLETERVLLEANQAAERALFAANAKADSPYAGLTDELTNLQNKLTAELQRDQGFYNLTDKNNHEMRDKIANEIAADQAAIAQVTGLMTQVGTASINGVAAGVEGGTAGLIAQIQAAMALAQQAAQAQLGIHSPSKVFANDVGKQIPAGVEMGVLSNIGAAVSAVATMGQQMSRAVVMPTMSQASVRPAMSSSQIANSYSYADSVNIGSFSAQNGVSRADVQAMINAAMVQSGRTAYARKITR